METALNHTYGQNCRLASVEEPKPDDALLEGIPPINAQFFYHSLIPIDDPLSTATITTAPDAKATKGILRPFSYADNNALERAWLSLASEDDRADHEAALESTKPTNALVARDTQRLDAIVGELIRKHREKHAQEIRSASLEPPQESLTSTDLAVCCQELPIDATNTLREAFCELSRRKQRLLNQEHVIAKVMSALESDRPTAVVTAPMMATTVSASSPRTETFVSSGLSTSARGRASSFVSNPPGSRSASVPSRAKGASLGTSPQLEKYMPKLSNIASQGHVASIPARSPVVEDGISGKPFLRVGNRDKETILNSTEPPQDTHSTAPRDHVTPEHAVEGECGQAEDAVHTTLDGFGHAEVGPRVVDVPVGVSRLHEVSLPVLQMKPIYWSPVNDIAIVSRATWFFKDTMVPVDPAVANQLEAGYRELRAFSQEWQEELRCAVEVGSLGEEKVSHPLWPRPVSAAAAESEVDGILEPPISSDPFCAARCFHGEASAEGTLEPVQAGPTAPLSSSASARAFAAYHVIYKDAKTAFLLKPSLKPSAYYSRKPIQKILKGLTIGIPVVRGFDRDSWDTIHEKKKQAPSTKGFTGSTSSAFPIEPSSPEKCPGCEADQARGQITDLVFVVHGIGQKFAERVESFHFTHAITAFRRAIQLQVREGSVKSVLRDNHNGIMVLPINWRHHLSFEDGGPMTDADKARSATDSFGLKDIEPNTIPAVRSLISE
ncbi:hypothetical protein SLS53_001183 [Cytospora paraplurivora]|uniref:DDHD domain-containing protein n=1 Tax=Cytospora paraplurivora TaxID=2898453 RepID=A0AAN9UJ27_9PEZI